MARFLGKYRGTVSNNIDPDFKGRIQAIVPDVTGDLPTSWALPCVPMAGLQCGEFAVPPIGAQVWIEFEQGKLDHPIWTGCFWGDGQVPSLALATPPPLQSIVLQTVGQNTLSISDLPGPPPGGILLKSATGASIAINATGITITNGVATIMLVGPSVTINGTALVVT